jgi:hypothetical protein
MSDLRRRVPDMTRPRVVSLTFVATPWFPGLNTASLSSTARAIKEGAS